MRPAHSSRQKRRLLPEAPVGPDQTVFLSIGVPQLAGYETVNWGDRCLTALTLLAKDAFVYGGAITLSLETYLTDRIVLLANIRERPWGSSWNCLQPNSDWESNSLSIKTAPSMTIEEIKAIPIAAFLRKDGI